MHTEQQSQEKINWGSATLGGAAFTNVTVEEAAKAEEATTETKVTDTTLEKTAEQIEAEKKIEEGKEGGEQEKAKGEEGSEGEEEKETVISQFIKKLPFEFKDELGRPIEFQNDVEGILQAAEMTADKFIEQRDEAFFAEYPEAKELFIHLQNGGTVDTFVKHSLPDYSKITIDATNVAQQKNIYTQLLKMKGLNASEIDELITSSVSGNTLLTKANGALLELNKFREQKLASERQYLEEKTKKEQLEAQETLKDVSTLLSKGKLLGVELDKRSQDSLVHALTAIDKKTGLRLIDQKENALTLEQELFIKYLILNDFKEILPKTAKKLEDLTELQKREKEAIIKGKGAETQDKKDKFDFGRVKMGSNGNLTMINN